MTWFCSESDFLLRLRAFSPSSAGQFASLWTPKTEFAALRTMILLMLSSNRKFSRSIAEFRWNSSSFFLRFTCMCFIRLERGGLMSIAGRMFLSLDLCLLQEGGGYAGWISHAA